MNMELCRRTDEYAAAHKKRAGWRLAAYILAAITALSTVYALIMPAITDERNVVCGMEEHQHDDKCYEITETLTCTFTEGAHKHTDTCRGKVKELVCGKEENSEHVHTGKCYGEQAIVCGNDERSGHKHGAECYGPRTLICTITEDGEHTHTSECYAADAQLICTQTEHPAHAHTEECRSGEAELICGEAEREAHTHSDECYKEEDGLICGMTEGEEHKHTEECYAREEKLICAKPEHIHDDSCFSDPNADRETREMWEIPIAAVELGDDRAANLIAIAQTQLGYTESINNYILNEETRAKQGYTRYGDWYGYPYGDWCAMFVSFCLHYAGITDIPYNSGCAAWVEQLSLPEYDLFRQAGTYFPKPGDIVFFDYSGTGAANHVGIVCGILEESSQIKTIEGNLFDRVDYGLYSLTDTCILGYAELPQKIEPEQTAELNTLTHSGEDYSVCVSYGSDANLPENVQLSVTEIAQGTAEYDYYYSQTISAVGMPSFCRFFDVSFIYDGQEIEPEASVSVQISYSEPLPIEEDTNCNAIHFAEDGTELLEATVEETEAGENTVSFTQESFSVVGTVITKTFTFEEGQKYIFYKSNADNTGGLALGVDNLQEVRAFQVEFNEKGYLVPTDGSIKIEYITWIYDGGYLKNAKNSLYLSFYGSGSYGETSVTPKLVSSRPTSCTPNYLIVGNAVGIEQDYYNSAKYFLGITDGTPTGWHSANFANATYFTVSKVQNVESVEIQPGEITIKDSIGENGTLTPQIKGETPESAKYTWYKSEDGGESWSEVERRKVTGELYNVAEDGSWLNAALDGGARMTYKAVLVELNGAVPTGTTESDPYTVPYFDRIVNGSFEEPVIPDSGYQEYYQPFLPNGTAEMIWQTTASDGQVEYLSVKYDKYKEFSSKWHNVDAAAKGVQFVELNAYEAGALYQDVLTVPGSTMYWQCAHRGRGTSADDPRTDTMAVVIMSVDEAASINSTDKLAAAISDGAYATDCTTDNSAWKYYNGTYVVPEGQYLTRYFFWAKSTANGDQTTGNHLDDVSFSTELPPPVGGSANLRVTKTVYGLDEENAKAVLKQLEFSVIGLSGTDTIQGSYFVNFRMNKDGSYSADYNKEVYIGANTSLTVTVEEDAGTAKHGKYNVATAVSTDSWATESKASTGSLTLSERQSGVIEFKNTYTIPDVKLRILKTDAVHTPLDTAGFAVANNADDTGSVNKYSATLDTAGGYTEVITVKSGYIYSLEELTAPDGYIRFTGKVWFKNNEGELALCTEDGTVLEERDYPGGITLKQESVDGVDTAVITVVNETGVTLPETGGIGIFTIVIVGALIAASPVIYKLSVRRRAGRRPAR